jgi:hypothetical protein
LLVFALLTSEVDVREVTAAVILALIPVCPPVAVALTFLSGGESGLAAMAVLVLEALRFLGGMVICN